MSAEGAAVVRPRTTGELLDDAWRLYLADAPSLLLLSAAFLAPAFAALVLLAGLPAPAHPVLRLLPPLAPLVLLVLSGVGSGACQEWLRARAEGRKPSAGGCLAAAFRRGLPHAAARALALIGPLLGLGVWLAAVSWTEKTGGDADPSLLLWRGLLTAVACLPGLLLWPFTATIHAFLASGKTRSLADLGEYVRQAGAETGKSGVVTLARTAVLLLVVVNLHLFVLAGLWVLDSLAGLDAAFIGLQLAIADPVYDLALVLLAWLLLAPFFETSAFLLHVDSRSRHEGLDLQVRVQRVFPTMERRRVGTLALLIGVFWLAAAPARAETTYDAVHAARLDVERIADGVKAADRFDRGRWQDELERTADRLEQAAGRDRFGWFRKAVAGFADRPKDEALKLLSDLDDRLALLEEQAPRDRAGPTNSPNDNLKGKLQQPGASGPAPDVQPDDDKPKDKKKPDEDDPDKKNDDNGRPAEGWMGPGAFSGCGPVGLMLTAGLALAGLLVGVMMVVAARKKGPAPARKPLVPAKAVQQTTERREPPPIERPAAELWREADELARKEQYLDAVRTLYLAVLSLLHRRQLLRFEPMRTNGEYVQQVRLAPQAPPALHAAFQEFTALFERKWYGDRACEAEEFRTARKQVEEVQALVREM